MFIFLNSEKHSFFLNLLFIYFWRGGEGAEREGDTESETGSRFWAVSTELEVGLELTSQEIMTWAEVGRSTDWATQVPQHKPFKVVEDKYFWKASVTVVLNWVSFFSPQEVFGHFWAHFWLSQLELGDVIASSD